MLPTPNTDNFQQQLNDLQRSYNQLGRSFGQPRSPKKLRYVPGIEGAKKHAQEELEPGDEDTVFDENEDRFFIVRKSPDGYVLPLLIGSGYTLENEPPKPEYATKQDFAELRKEILELLKKEVSE